MKKKLFFIKVLITAILLVSSTMLLAQQVLDGIAAIVGDEIILRTELLQTAQGFAIQMGIDPATQPKKFAKLKKDVLNNLINEKVLLAKAKEDTITVDDQRVEAALEGRIQELIKRLGSKEKVEAYFGAPINKIKRDYREDIRDQLIVQTLQQKKLGTVQISRSEVKKFYKTMKDSLPERKPMVKLRHILLEVRPGKKARERAMAQIREVQSKLRQGESFEKLAKQYSEDPATAGRGGDLGFVERGTLFHSFEETAFSLKPGEISDVVETPVGLHLIQMIEKRGDKVRVRHILIRLETTPQDEKAVIDTLNMIRNKTLAGEDFAKLAKEYSQDTSTKEQGGDLGWMPLEQLQIEAFKNAVDTLKTGQISRPFKTRFGYHIVKLEGKKTARKFSLKEDWDQIREWALNAKRQRILNQWINDLKKNIYIEIKKGVL